MADHLPKMPVVFIGHGAPTLVLSDNRYTRAWRQLAQSLPRPQAIMVVSAHWLTRGKTLVTAMPQPRTLHDFGRMDARLFQMQYLAPGAPALAKRIAQQVSHTRIALDESWGLDHGAWCPLAMMYPQADIPVIQLSMNADQPPAAHYALAQQLAFLRTEGVLVLCSGNIVHNLRRMVLPEDHAFDWAQRFDQAVCAGINSAMHQPLLDYVGFGEDARLAVPTSEHYLPLLYALALKDAGDRVRYPVEGFAYGSISMRSVLIG
ncbi:Aromatic ring-opening dioxygenase, catalytic subunit, LigB family [Thiothrix caldifontis]|uniref:Aromatic ring-opening dioxygenase, catalytic subunit, LigB family n=1 Tax=Thiothrix caldifontis TaxID=525918 RepID=A0A1H4G4Q5_9GAMM|nr:4,5-DOPA dioxygenase extradiol [Thiothrix caldifontis]SEB03908.1 Aromatic ring-opening dioxygenase, catalytic subunit, LigB family [Thiothrix caldifontis]